MYVEAMTHAGERMDTLIAALPAERGAWVVVQKMSRADCHMYLQEYAQARGVLRETISVANKPVHVRDMYLLFADACNKGGDWGAAKEALADAAEYLSQSLEGANHAMRKWLHYNALALAELGEYDKAVVAAEAAIELNRHYQGVYQPLVKCYLDQGQLDVAILWMRKAVAYEAPWDAAHTAKLTKQLVDLRSHHTFTIDHSLCQ